MTKKEKRILTDHDRKVASMLMELLVTDVSAFYEITNIKPENVEVCLLRKHGLTMTQIAIKTGLPKTNVQYHCRRCEKSK